MSSDQEGFKVPSLPIGRVKHNTNGGRDESAQHEAEQSSELNDTTTSHSEKQAENSETQKAEQQKPTSKGKQCVCIILV